MHTITILIDIVFGTLYFLFAAISIWCVGCLFWWLITDIFWDNFKIVNGRLRRRRVRYWQFGGF